MINRLERHMLNLEHVRWSVAFYLTLLDAHRRTTIKRDPAWHSKEAEYLKLLMVAQAELDRLSAYEVPRWREDEPASLVSAS